MKRIYLLIPMFLISVLIFGQAQEGTVEYLKNQQPAAFIELPYETHIVNEAMNDYLSKKGKSRVDDLKGFTTYRNTQLIGKDSVNADLYFKVERRDKQQKEVSIIYLLLTMPKEGSVTVNNVHHLNMEQAKTYLNELLPAIEAYNLELLIKHQNESIIKGESKFKNLMDDASDLEKKRLTVENNILENKQNQKIQRSLLEIEKLKLAGLIKLRKS